MSTAALDLIQGALGPQVLADAAERLSEEPAALGRFVGAGVPAVLGLLIERGTAPGGAEALLAAMRRTGAARALADPLSRLERGAQPDPDLVGDDLSARLANYAGVSESSAAALTAMLTPLALGAVARIAPTPLTPETLARTLREQAAEVRSAVPPGFDAAGEAQAALASAPATEAPAAGEPVVVPTPFLEPVADTAPPQPIPVVQPPAAVPDAPAPTASGGGGLSRWLLIAVALLMVLALAYVLLGNLGAGEPGDSPAEPSGTSAPAASGAATP